MQRYLVVIVLLFFEGALGYCPSLCTCKGNKSLDGSTSELQPEEPLKLKCGGSPAQITELKEIDLSKLWNLVVSLNLSGNAISTLSRELHLPNLQKLDLSRNQINLVESDAFYNMTSLQRLDLSYNQISNIYKEMFKGLVNLERLILTQNLISTLSSGTFDYLVGLKQLDITENPLICDCDLLWVGDWSRNTSVKLVGNPKCRSPENMVNKTVRKLKIFLDLSACGSVLPSNTLIVKPVHDQVVFEGDTLMLTCNAPFASVLAKYELKWVHPMLEICDVNVTNTDMQEEGIAETTVFFPNITNHHTGNWTCLYSDQNRIRHNHTVQVLVLSNKTQYCETNHTVTNKGLYSWPQLLLNHTAVVPCRSGEGFAYRHCFANATWGPVNSTECAYISNVTKLLQQFALLNVSLVQYSALNATERLAMLIQEKTYPLAEINDPDDVMFIAQAIRNYMQYMIEERDLGASLLDVISSAMNITPSVMTKAETLYGSCTDMLRAVEEISAYTNNVQGHKVKLAVERFAVREGFSGVTCVWYSAAAAPHPAPPPRLHCSTTNRTVAPLLTVSDALIHASVQIPQSLLYGSLSSGGLVQGAAQDLVVALYEDASLLPLLPALEVDGPPRGHRSKDYYGRSTKREDMNMEITSPVVGFQLSESEMQGELLEPVIATVRARAAGGVEGRAAVWDPALRRWTDNTTDCKVSHVVSEMIIISCTRLAYVGLLQNVETGIYGARTDGARFKVSHPAVYVGSLILIGCLACAALTYAMCHPAILMPRKAKHALVNTWAALGLLCFLYTLGIYQTEDVKLCQVLGLLIHYLSLCCLLWMCVSASNMYKWATKTQGPVRSPEEELPPDAPAHKPILGLYLVGWGIALIVCGISGAVNLKDYAGYSQCFLSTAPALASLFIPGGILLLFLLVLFLLIRCTIRNMNVQLSEGTQATENLDLEMLEPSAAAEGAERRSTKSALDSELEDVEHAPIIQLRAQVIVLCLYMAVWTCGAVAVYRPLPAYLPYQEDICSIVYAVCATVLGTFILFFYGIARSDVRAQWSLMQCYFQKSKQCCRNRSVFDANQPTLQTGRGAAPAPPPLSNDNRSRSDSRSSNRTKTNNSGTYKAGAELNGQTLQKDLIKNTNGKAPNINLVVLHRQQYRSNNSMMTYPEPGGVAPDLFYNPNQMNVAKKFFKKQRQHMKRNCLELPVRRDCDDDSHVSLPLPSRGAYDGVANIINAGTKVNNTNLHVDRTTSGIKEPRNAANPNLLEEEPRDDFKSYAADRKSWARSQDPKICKSQIMNIYTNVPETQVPQHQVVKANAPKTQNGPRSSASEECLRTTEPAEMRTVSQQCSLEYSSASELAAPHTASDHTLDTHSELTSCRDTPSSAPTPSAPCSANEDISEECTMLSDDAARDPDLDPASAGEADALLHRPADDLADDKETFFLAKTTYDSETGSTTASEQGFENDSDIYCPDYQVSEVSIRSHGLYAPSPSAMCPHEISFSAEDVAHDSQYVNYCPAWRAPPRDTPRAPAPALSCPEVSRPHSAHSAHSAASDLDELYTRITSRDRPAHSATRPAHSAHTARSPRPHRPHSARSGETTV
ncbi:putative G-protein coupled receptor 125 [Papilio machaon]|uniref:Putative G-protein coupled receptor 125 n=1 Tax=Papilio machaon TaxID=76193 RepID=A0A194RFV9_PAPMA|nr:putative G-protein coupled receptor 125 [Papilio machaon]